MRQPLSYKIFGPLFRHQPFNRLSESIEKALTKARIPIAGDVYLSDAFTQSILSSVMLIPFIFLLYQFNLIKTITNFLPEPVSLITLIFPFLPIIALITTLSYFYIKPHYAVLSRKQNIDQNIHHASAFLYAMTKSGLQPIESLERLAEQKSIYGLVAEEFGMVVRRIRYFGEDLTTALRYVANTTSSKNLKEFIYSFILATQQSLSAGAYFRMKFNEFLEIEKQNREAQLKTLNLVGEIAVVLVALSPTLVLSVSLSLGVLNPSILALENIYMILILPISSILVLFYVRAILPSNKLISVTKAAFSMPLIENIQIDPTPPQPKAKKTKEKNFDKNEKRLLFKNSLKKPIQLFFIYPWFYFLVAAIALAGFLGYFYLIGTSPQQVIVCSLLGSCLIVLLYHEVKSRYVMAVERRIPTFLRGLSETVEREGSIIRAINLVLQSKLGLLGREMKKIGSTKLGFPLKRAMLMIEYRTASLVLKRVLSLLVIASESTKNMKDILVMAADDADSFIRLRRERTLNLIGYIISTYVCFGVYIYVYYTLKVSFIPSLSGISGFAAGSIFSVVMIQGYYVSLFLALILGLLVGAMAEGSVLSGLKHSLVMIIITIVMLGWAP